MTVTGVTIIVGPER